MQPTRNDRFWPEKVAPRLALLVQRCAETHTPMMIKYTPKPKARANGKNKPTQAQMVNIMRKAAARMGAPRLSGPPAVYSAAPAALGSEFHSSMEFLPSKRKGGYRDSICIRGQEWLGPVTVPANAVAGQTLRNDYVQPGAMLGTRLAQFGQLYEKFLFTRLNLRYTPAIGSGQAGSIILAYDRDISDPTPPATQQAVREYLSWEDSIQGNVWAPHVLRSKLESPETGFYTDDSNGGDERLSYQGQFYVAIADPLGNASPINIGSVSLEYELHLFVPQLQTPVVTAAFSNSGGTLPTAADALRQYGVTASGVLASAAANLLWAPKGQTAGSTSSAIRLAEGLYRFFNRAVQSSAGGLTFSAPTLIALEPVAAVGSQPQVRQIQQASSAAVADTCFWDGLLDVPRGGADLLQTFATFGATPSTSAMNIQRIGDYLPDVSAASVF